MRKIPAYASLFIFLFPLVMQACHLGGLRAGSDQDQSIDSWNFSKCNTPKR